MAKPYAFTTSVIRPTISVVGLMSLSGVVLLLTTATLLAVEPSDEPGGVMKIRRDAAALQSLVKSELARQFLEATADLPAVSSRTIYLDAPERRWYSTAAMDRLPPETKASLEARTIDETGYYETKYGSPLAYVRALEVLAGAGLTDVAGRRILDFGYGSVGHLRLLASLGADAVGVDLDSYLTALYCESADQGAVKGRRGTGGRVILVDGSFPADPAVGKAIGEGYDLFISKNTLKNGYIHPAEPVDPRRLVHLGVSEEAFVTAIFERLKPGGRALIYNICPAPARPGQPYIPWADGRCPFPRPMWESAGFRVIAFDQDDSPAVRAMGHALGWDQGEGAMDLTNDLFASYTLAEKPGAR